MDISTVIGFDLGHGEMALTRQAVVGRAEPEVIEIHGKRSQITAIAEGATADGAPVTLIGDDAVEAFDLSAPEATLLEIGFKGHPARNSKAEKFVPLFATAVYQYLLDREQVDPNAPTEFFIGYPSGWSAAERGDYQRLLRQSRIPRLTTVAESRAALAHAKETGALTQDQLRGPVLVIDIGSSTTDFTLQRSLTSETSSFGLDLGAALIDRAILERVLPAQRHARELQDLIARYPSYRNRLELVCRKAKEGYFRRLDSDLYRQSGQRPSHKEMEDIQRRLVFRVTVDGPLMDEILTQSLAELGGQSWQDAFRAAALDVRRRWIETEGLTTGVVLATGGASRMDFVPKVCQEVFAGWRYVAATEPDLTIARGLARWGRNLIRTAGFDRDVARFMREELPQVVEAAAPDLIRQLAGPLTDGLIREVIQPGLRDWRAHRVRTLADLEGHLTTLTETWLQSDSVRALVNEVIGEWLRPVLASVHAELSPICSRYGIAGDPFSILADFDPNTMLSHDLSQAADWGQLINSLRDLVGGTSAAVVAALVFAVQATFFRFGPVGWVVSAIATGAALLVGKGVAEEYVKTINVPYPTRGPILSESRITSISQQHRDRIAATVQALLESGDLGATLTRDVGAKLGDILQGRVAEVRLLIN